MMPDTNLQQLACRALEERDRPKRIRILQQIFDGYNASSDWPGMAFVDDLLDMYPDCAIILNKRHSARAWEESVCASLRFFSTWRYFLLTCWISQSYWHHMVYRVHSRVARRKFGVRDVFTVECYERHNEWVREVAAARGKEVLEWEPEDGWPPLCRFLGREVPLEPFPRTNETAEIAELKIVLVKRGLWAWARVLTAAALLIVAALLLKRWRQ